MQNLAAASQFDDFYLFLTLTCNQAEHPGIRHLHQWKQSMGWTLMVPEYSMLQLRKKQEVKQLFEMAYSSVMNIAWLEV